MTAVARREGKLPEMMVVLLLMASALGMAEGAGPAAPTEPRRRPGVVAAAEGGNSTAPVWPRQLRATLLQNRSNQLALVTLYYNFDAGRNYNVVVPQLDPAATMYDLEYGNGSTFYWFPGEGRCSLIEMPVGILRPTWIGDSGRSVAADRSAPSREARPAGEAHRNPPLCPAAVPRAGGPGTSASSTSTATGATSGTPLTALPYTTPTTRPDCPCTGASGAAPSSTCCAGSPESHAR